MIRATILALVMVSTTACAVPPEPVYTLAPESVMRTTESLNRTVWDFASAVGNGIASMRANDPRAESSGAGGLWRLAHDGSEAGYAATLALDGIKRMASLFPADSAGAARLRDLERLALAVEEFAYDVSFHADSLRDMLNDENSVIEAKLSGALDSLYALEDDVRHLY